jgi:hypothetical protein
MSESSSAVLPLAVGNFDRRVAKSETMVVYHFLISVKMRAMSASPVSKCATKSCASDGIPGMLSHA